MPKNAFYCCSLEYAMKLSEGKQTGRAPLFMTNPDPTEPIDRPCLATDCPIAAVHSQGPYRYLGAPVPEFLKEELASDLGESASEFWGQSNPPPAVWLGFWSGELASVRGFLKHHVLGAYAYRRCSIQDKSMV